MSVRTCSRKFMKVTICMIFFHYRKIKSVLLSAYFFLKEKNRSEFSFMPNYSKFYPLISQDLILSLNVHVTVGDNAHRIFTEFESA